MGKVQSNGQVQVQVHAYTISMYMHMWPLNSSEGAIMYHAKNRFHLPGGRLLATITPGCTPLLLQSSELEWWDHSCYGNKGKMTLTGTQR